VKEEVAFFTIAARRDSDLATLGHRGAKLGKKFYPEDIGVGDIIARSTVLRAA
jgi:hypothetical protein